LRWKNFYEQFNCFFFTNRIVEQIPLLKPLIHKAIFLEKLSFYSRYYSISIHGYVIMDNHFHIIISNLKEHPGNTQKFIQHLLRNTSKSFVVSLQNFMSSELNPKDIKEILEVLGRKVNKNQRYRVWKEHSRGVPIWNSEMLFEKLEYIHNNPVKAGIVENPKDYLFSSARYYLMDEPGLVHIDKLPI